MQGCNHDLGFLPHFQWESCLHRFVARRPLKQRLKQVGGRIVAEFWAMSRSAKERVPHIMEPERPLLSLEDARGAEAVLGYDYTYFIEAVDVVTFSREVNEVSMEKSCMLG